MGIKFNRYAAIAYLALIALTSMAQPMPNSVIGAYENHSESSFIQQLTLSKDGVAIYREPDMEGGKAFVAKGKWTQSADTVEVDLGKRGKHVYTVTPNLSWAEIGCKGL